MGQNLFATLKMICSKSLYTVQVLGPTFKGHFNLMSDI